MGSGLRLLAANPGSATSWLWDLGPLFLLLWKRDNNDTSVLVFSGWSNNTINGWLIHNGCLLLTALEAASPRSRCHSWWEPFSCFINGVFSLRQCGGRVEGALCGLAYKGTNPVPEGCNALFWLSHLPRAPLPNAVTLAVSISTCEHGGTETLDVQQSPCGFMRNRRYNPCLYRCLAQSNCSNISSYYLPASIRFQNGVTQSQNLY